MPRANAGQPPGPPAVKSREKVMKLSLCDLAVAATMVERLPKDHIQIVKKERDRSRSQQASGASGIGVGASVGVAGGGAGLATHTLTQSQQAIV